MFKMKGVEVLSIAVILLSSLPKSDEYCITDKNGPIHTCSNMNAEELPTIVNIFLDTNVRIEELLLVNNNISVIGDTVFASDWSNRIEQLRIIKSNVEFIMIGSFEKITNLRYLEISDNNLKAFDGMVLQGLKKLETLHLRGNNLESLENICSAATNLQEVIVERNNRQVKNIPANAFQDCKNLVKLHLTGLDIENIGAGFAENLTNLKQLNLTSNNLNSLQFLATSKPLRLESLDVSNNHLTEVESELFRVSLNSLIHLNLTNNDISVFMKDSSESFTCKIEMLYLTSNKISVINKDLFKYFSKDKFRYLDIDYNPLDKIEPDAFENVLLRTLHIKNSLQKFSYLKQGMFNKLGNLFQLDLSNANIGGIEKDTFKDLMQLEELYLQNNNIQALYNGTFNGLNSVKDFNLSNNPVSSIEAGAFFGLRNVKEIEPRNFFTGVKRIQTRQFEGLAYSYVDKLDLSYLEIESLDELAFKGLFALHTLRLDNNNITNLVENTFIGLDYLESLNISRNNLVTVNKNVFAKLGKLTNLDLSGNQISVLHIDTFNPVFTLSSLDLSNNKFIAVDSGLFKKLRWLKFLHLDNNMITHLKVHGFSGLNSIIEISLFGNHIHKVDSGAFIGLRSYSDRIAPIFTNIIELRTLEPNTFVGLDNLRHLDLSNKPLGSMKSFAFSGIDSLQELLLNNCSISILPPNAFVGPYIESLNLANNKLITIESASLNGSNIGQLNLTGNMIENVNIIVFESVRKLYLYSASVKNVNNFGNNSMQLELIDLRDNFISTIESNLFKNMNNLKELYLSGNPISLIKDNSFISINNLKTLSLSVVNLRLNGNIFSGLQNINEILIQNSTITAIETGTFSEIEANILNINTNQIGKIYTKAFRSLRNLTLLNLSNNHLEYIEENAFEDLHSLKTLDLSNNNLLYIPCSIFSNLDSLENLYLNKNMIENLSPCTFKSLHNSRLKNLDLSFNSLVEIEDSGIFSPVSYLHTLNLSHNALKYISDSELYHMRNAKSLDLSNNKLQIDYDRFEVGKWEILNIRGNAWNCRELLNIRKLNYAQNNNIYWEVNDDHNINGIPCEDPVSPTPTTMQPTTSKYN